MKKVKLMTKTSPTETILSLPVGVPTPIKNTQIKASNLKSTIYRMRKRGCEIEYSEKDRIDDMLVTLISKGNY